MCSIIAVVAAGCASQTSRPLLSPTAKLLRNKSIVIAVPANGVYSGRVYAASGKVTAQAVQAAFSPYSYKVTILDNCSEITCLQAVSTSDYLVLPVILHWEDRATEWSGKRDKLSVKISVFDGVTKSEIASTIISGKSRLLTFGGDHPDDLLQRPISEFVASLY
jgi:hypothetical protein